MFIARVNSSTGDVPSAVRYGAAGATVTPMTGGILESAPVVGGHTDSALDTPGGTLSCPGNAAGCSFVVRLPLP